MTPVVVLADCGGASGLGHAMRAVALSAALARLNVASTVFTPTNEVDGTTRAGETHAARLSLLRGVRADLVVLDTYFELDALSATAQALGALVVVFDDRDLLTRPVDLLVDAAPAAVARGKTHIQLLGPRYAIGRASPRRGRPGPVHDILVALGGNDAHGRLTPARAALRQHFDDDQLTFVGRARGATWMSPLALHQRLERADLAVFAGGTMLAQSAAAGCPVIAWPQNEAQRAHVQQWCDLGSVVSIDTLDELDARLVEVEDRTKRAAMSRAGQRAVDGRGGHRLAMAISQLLGRYSRSQ